MLLLTLLARRTRPSNTVVLHPLLLLPTTALDPPAPDPTRTTADLRMARHGLKSAVSPDAPPEIAALKGKYEQSIATLLAQQRAAFPLVDQVSNKETYIQRQENRIAAERAKQDGFQAQIKELQDQAAASAARTDMFLHVLRCAKQELVDLLVRRAADEDLAPSMVVDPDADPDPDSAIGLLSSAVTHSVTLSRRPWLPSLLRLPSRRQFLANRGYRLV